MNVARVRRQQILAIDGYRWDSDGDGIICGAKSLCLPTLLEAWYLSDRRLLGFAMPHR